MAGYRAAIWKKIPFLKLLLALISGILLQWYYPLHVRFWIIVIIISLALLMLVFKFSYFNRFRFVLFPGMINIILFVAAGAMLTWRRDIRNSKKWVGHHYEKTQSLVAVLEEPPVEKQRTYKAVATVKYLIRHDSTIEVIGRVLLYIDKKIATGLEYGSRILFKKQLQPVRRSGNPGGFDYRDYCLFQGITHQVYLDSNDLILLKGTGAKPMKSFLVDGRKKIISILKKYIPGEKELGLAEALLIGYKNDLDKTLVQSYTNTGVVHIIAISGLHVGLIYWLLLQVFRPLRKNKIMRWIVPIFIICGLWLFSFLAGAQPSILRSALMFTCIVLEKEFSRKNSVYNTISVSAFVLLSINPFWLWDIGFQLSYAAVFSIIAFMRPIYNCIYIRNRWLDRFWQLNAVTLSAQVMTIPVCIYHFHQFPNYFLFTNMVAVPFSTLILFSEIILVSISFIPIAAFNIGKLVSWFISIMNRFIEIAAGLPYATWEGLLLTQGQAHLLLLTAASLSFGLAERSGMLMKTGLASLTAFMLLRAHSFINANRQERIIVYNVPGKSAVDLISGRKVMFVGDEEFQASPELENFHLKPTRIIYRIKNVQSTIIKERAECINFTGQRILLIKDDIKWKASTRKDSIDLLIISKNPKLYINNLRSALEIKMIVFDASVPAWKSRYWKKDCDSLNIRWHDVSEAGAFVMKGS